MPASACIRVRGARTHNLKNVDLDIPRDQLVVITGPSGSGKSSLAFDTLFAEGRRQYLETLSLHTRQFLRELPRPDVDLVDGLEPTLCLDQQPGPPNPRATVATITEIHDHLRVLFARVGEPACPRCGAVIRQQSPGQIERQILALPTDTRFMVLAPLTRAGAPGLAECAQLARKAGLQKLRVNGEVRDLDALPAAEPAPPLVVEAVIDRLKARAGVESRLAEALALALRLGEGRVIACHAEPPSASAGAANAAGADGASSPGTWRDLAFCTRLACPRCDVDLPELEPRSFSFNSPHGACPACAGLGVRTQFDPELVVLRPERSLDDNAAPVLQGVRPALLKKFREFAEPMLAAAGFAWSTPLVALPPEALNRLLRGNAGELGLLTLLEQDYATASEGDRQQQLEAFRGEVVCSACGGSRLRPESNATRVAGKTLHEITRLDIAAAAAFFEAAEFAGAERPIAEPLTREIVKRLRFLRQVGVEYLTLDRPTDSLSGGEHQRVRLAACVGSGLVGVCYILDEPSIGLHPRDNDRLIEALRALRDQGNSVLVVEHDEAMMRAADWLVDVGPGAGAGGGRVVAQGPPAAVAADPASPTGAWLAGRRSMPRPAARRKALKSRAITLGGVTTNNLRDVEAWFPLGVLTCVTGVSGSGKSSLVNETLARALARRLGGAGPKPGPHKSLRGAQQIDRVIHVDQSPIGRSARSNAASYVGAYDAIRKVFAATREAKQRGFRANRFSFNLKGGRCERCQGQGVTKLEMNFLPDFFVTCPACGGARFEPQTLAIRYRGQSIADVLAMSVDEAAEFFENFADARGPLEGLRQVGLGYLPLGQSATELSGGEAQRVKLAAELCRPDAGHTLYLLDEPTTGLHFDDVRKLLEVLHRLVDQGHTVIVIEHHLDVIKSADWLIDLGPGGGAHGGWITFAGPPEQLAEQRDHPTGQFLGDLRPA